MNLRRIHRLLRLITILQVGTARSAEDLAAEMGVSRRTLFRDLATLEEAGVPYSHDPASGYRIEPGFFLPPVNLKVSEAMGLMLLAKSAETQKSQPFYREAVAGVQKLAASMPDSYREVAGDIVNRVTIRPGYQPATPDDTSNFIHLQRAIEQQLVCHMTYHSLFDKGQIELDFHPYAMHFAVRSWYAIGKSVMHKQVRIFKLARIEQLKVTEKPFNVPRGFSVQKHLGNAWSLIPDDTTYEIELLFHGKMARNVAEVTWHHTQRCEMLDDGNCRVQFTVDGLDEISWWLLGYGDSVTVVKPKALRTKLAEAHAAAAKKHRGGGKV